MVGVFINRTHRFQELREQALTGVGDSGEISVSVQHLLQDSPGHQDGVKPAWMDSVEEVKVSMDSIRKKMVELEMFHRGGVDPDSSQELTRQITAMFTRVLGRIQRITMVKVGTKLPVSEIVMRRNVQSGLAQELRALSTEFRESQKGYLLETSRTAQRRRDLMRLVDEGGEIPPSSESPSDISFTQDLVNRMSSGEETVSAREQEILEISRNVNELAEMFKQINIMVIDQGTVLDRIDYNLEEASRHTSKAVQEITQAAVSQRSFRCKLLILVLILIIVGFVVGLIVKLSN